MGVTFIAPGEQFTSPARLITKEITEDGTYYAADDNANGYSSVEVSVGGGGGSSDFSTAEVQISTNYSKANFTIPLPNIDANDTLVPTVTASLQLAVDALVVLYKNKPLVVSTSGQTFNSISVTGDITYANNELTITGDGTITVS